MLNFASWVFDTGMPDKLAIVDDEHSLTYHELQMQSIGFASYLQSKNIKAQDRIAISLDDSIEWPVAFFGCLIIGANPVLISPMVPVDKVNEILNLCDAKLLISKSSIQTELPVINNILGHKGTVDKFYQYHPDEPCLWLLTSGTSGEYKCTVHRHDLFNFPQKNPKFKDWFGINSNSRIFSTAKMSWAYGFSCSITTGLGSGATVFVRKGPPAPTRVFEILDNNSIDHFFTIPAILNSIVKHNINKSLPQDLKIYAGGEPITKTLIEIFQENYNLPIYNVIGTSEVGVICGGQTQDNYAPGALGGPLPGFEFKLIDENGDPTTPGQTGELWIKSQSLALYYWKNWNSNKYSFQGPWFRTGDQFLLAENNDMFFVGRTDDLLKINGLFVAPFEIESVIGSISGITDCAVVSKANTDKETNNLHAFIVGDIDIDAVRKVLVDTLPLYKIPKHITKLTELPKTVTNKTQRGILRDSKLG